MTRNSELGGKLGPRLVDLVTRAQIIRARELGDHWANVGSEALQRFHGVIGREITAHTRDYYRMFADDPSLPDDIRSLFHFVSLGEGQAAGLISEAATSTAVSQTIGAIFNNLLANPIATYLHSNPLLELGVDEAVSLFASGMRPFAYALNLSERAGYQQGRFSDLVDIAQHGYGPGEALELFRRGRIDFEELDGALRRDRMAPELTRRYAELAKAIDSPADLARAVVRGLVDRTQALPLAAQSGFSPDQLDLLIGITGQPLSTQELLEAYRRGIIGKDRLEHGIRQGDLRNEWIDVAEALRYAPPSIGDVLAGAVTNHLDQGRARTMAQEAGLDPDNFDWMLETHGRPPGTQELLHLLNRGLMSEAEVVQGIRESDVKNKYIPAILNMRFHLLPERTIASIYAKGVLPATKALEKLGQLGISPEDAGYVLAAAKAEKTQAHHDLSVSQITELYQLEAIERKEAKARIEAHGYDQAEADELLDLADMLRAKRLQDQATAVVRSKYLSRRIERSVASSSLDQVKVPAAAREQLLAIWDLEREITTRELTPAQLVAAAKHSVLTYQETADRLVGLGYDPGDAQILLAVAGLTGGAKTP